VRWPLRAAAALQADLSPALRDRSCQVVRANLRNSLVRFSVGRSHSQHASSALGAALNAGGENIRGSYRRARSDA
jgi:hypothetical protein